MADIMLSGSLDGDISQLSGSAGTSSMKVHILPYNSQLSFSRLLNAMSFFMYVHIITEGSVQYFEVF